MRVHLTKVIEGSPPELVVRALEKCLKREAWEVRRYEMQVVALGIGASPNKINPADSATFDIESSDGVTTVLLEAEYQHVWFLTEESQKDTVNARFESVFTNMRAALNLPSESLCRQRDEEELPSFSAGHADPPNSSTTTTESIPVPELHCTEGGAAHEAAAAEIERCLTIPPTLPDPGEAPEQSCQSSARQRHFIYRTASLLGAFAIALMSVVFWLFYTKAHLLGGNAAKPSPSKQRPPERSSSKPGIRPTQKSSGSLESNSPTDGLNRGPASLPVDLEDPRRRLEQWAAAQRTRDAQRQASFYADEVRPYLSLKEASREAIYLDKQSAILSRKGLWTFNIEDVSVHRESANMASVVLKKHFMSQRGSVQVFEQRISSFLTLKRTRDGWQITGERDCR